MANNLNKPWLKLDCGFSDDLYIIEIENQYGEVASLYYLKILGLMRLTKDLRLKKDATLIARAIHAKKKKVVSQLIEDTHLFRHDEEGYIYSERLRTDVKEQTELSEKRTDAVNKRWNKKDTTEPQEYNENTSNILINNKVIANDIPNSITKEYQTDSKVIANGMANEWQNAVQKNTNTKFK